MILPLHWQGHSAVRAPCGRPRRQGPCGPPHGHRTAGFLAWAVGRQQTRKKLKDINFNKESIMNKNQVHGAVKDLAGKVQEEAGKLVGNKVQEAKGLQKQVAGKAEEHLGDAKEKVKEARELAKAATAKS